MNSSYVSTLFEAGSFAVRLVDLVFRKLRSRSFFPDPQTERDQGCEEDQYEQIILRTMSEVAILARPSQEVMQEVLP
jgi:hypothetical protein